MNERFNDPRLTRLYEYWWARRRSDLPPRRRDLDPIDLPGLLPILHLIDVMWRPLRFRHRLVGTEIVRHMGRDVTGRVLDESLYGPATNEILDSLTSLAMERRPYGRQARLDWHGRQWLAIESVELPLVDDDGQVTMILRGCSFETVDPTEGLQRAPGARLRLWPLPPP